MFCRFCGAEVPADSRFCKKCGARLVSGGSPRVEAVVRKLRLKTPYPYAALLFLAFLAWAAQPRQAGVDYSILRMELEMEGQSGLPDENVYRHHLSLVVENLSPSPVRDIPIEFRARIEPEQPVEVVSDFLGRQLVILRNGDTLPLVVILADEVAGGGKRRFTIDGIVTTDPPARVIYEVVGEDTEEVLASFATDIARRLPPAGGPIALGRVRAGRTR